MNKKRFFIVSLVLVLISPLFAKPSWCKYAHTYVEKKICRNKKLIDLDYEESAIYTRIRDFLKYEDKKLYKLLLKDEEKWVRERDTDCYNMSDRCIEIKYREGIRELYSLVRD
jgi:uncharacterized protein